MAERALPASAPTLAPAPASTSTSITQQAIEATVAQVKRDHPRQVRVAVTNADGGTATLSLDYKFKQLDAAGYVGWRKRQGIELGAEIVWDLGDRDRDD